MKAVIFAGGLGTRLSEETHLRPKPMVEIGGKPILWHIMKIYSAHGVNDFLILCGYKSEVIKEYFCNYMLHASDMTVDLAKGKITYLNEKVDPWKITMIDTGLETQTGGRLKRAAKYLGNEDFCLTYGDGVSDVNISELIKFHKKHGKLATVTAVYPDSRFGALEMDGDRIKSFKEKPAFAEGKINGGFFVLNPRVLEYIRDDKTAFEHRPMSQLAREGELMAFKHEGFWKPMDTLRDKVQLEKMWETDDSPWRVWRD
ncbi:MAG TPA: glucose-1-phosphate cytidylyltransferase [Alphaproteobacteria bacterium]|nr:glucose-1-phosphate cytidylyltransferase [Alphaproteobacteria bacterium]